MSLMQSFPESKRRILSRADIDPRNEKMQSLSMKSFDNVRCNEYLSELENLRNADETNSR